MTRKKIIFIIFVFLSVILLVGKCVQFISYDINSVPTGREVYRCISPDGRHTLIAYESETSLSSVALRGEIQDNLNGNHWNIYWQYKPKARNFSWKDNHTVIINEKDLNIYNDRYDYRREQGGQ